MEENKEIWKPIKGYEDLYEVSNLGNVRSKKTKRNRKFSDHHGYNRVTLSKNNELKSFFVHCLVAEAFIDNSRIGVATQINHKDENRKNNNYENLEWVTAKENCNYGNHCQNIANSIKKGTKGYENLQRVRKEKGLGRKKVRCITTGLEFNSMHEAGIFYNCCEKNIAANAYGRRKSCGSLPDGTKLVWEFIDEDDSEVSE